MKKFFVIAILATFSLLGTAVAAVNRFEQGLIVFDAVPWEIGQKFQTDHLKYVNTTTESQFIQINVTQGDVNVHVANDKMIGCISVIGGGHENHSKFCVIPPNSALNIGLEAHTTYAKGDYQVGI